MTTKWLMLSLMAATSVSLSVVIAVILYYVKKSSEPDWRSISVATSAEEIVKDHSSWFRIEDGIIFGVVVENTHALDSMAIAKAIKYYAEQLGYVVTEIAVEGKVIENAHNG